MGLSNSLPGSSYEPVSSNTGAEGQFLRVVANNRGANLFQNVRDTASSGSPDLRVVRSSVNDDAVLYEEDPVGPFASSQTRNTVANLLSRLDVLDEEESSSGFRVIRGEGQRSNTATSEARPNLRVIPNRPDLPPIPKVAAVQENELISTAKALLESAELDLVENSHLDAWVYLTKNKEALGRDAFTLEDRALQIIKQREGLSDEVCLEDAADLLARIYLIDSDVVALNEGFKQQNTRWGVIKDTGNGRYAVDPRGLASHLRSLKQFEFNTHASDLASSVDESPRGIHIGNDYHLPTLRFVRRFFGNGAEVISDGGFGTTGRVADTMKAADTSRPYSAAMDGFGGRAEVIRTTRQAKEARDLSRRATDALGGAGFGGRIGAPISSAAIAQAAVKPVARHFDPPTLNDRNAISNSGSRAGNVAYVNTPSSKRAAVQRVNSQSPTVLQVPRQHPPVNPISTEPAKKGFFGKVAQSAKKLFGRVKGFFS